MGEWEAPAKVNLDLRVGRLGADGYHRIRSLVQAVEWCDLLAIEEAEEDSLQVEEAELPEGGENLVWKAVEAVGGAERRPRLSIRLRKEIPVSAGLGGGSSDAAAVIAALGEMMRLGADGLAEAAARTGADVAFFLTGGSAWIEGRGEVVTAAEGVGGFALAVAVPPFGLATADVYRRWDELGEPEGPALSGRALPPSLRPHAPLRNDLTPAAVSLQPDLADWMADLAREWGMPVAMTGSGPAVFGFFADDDEAAAAAEAAASGARAVWGGRLRSSGVRRVEAEG